MMDFDLDDPTEREQVRAALEAFLAAQDELEMAQVVEDFPFAAQRPFGAGVRELIEHASRVGDAEALLRLQGQLELLQFALANHAQSDDERALLAFLYALDDAAATEVFQRNAAQLRSAAVRKALFALEADDPESDLHLEQRRSLWQRLVGGDW